MARGLFDLSHRLVYEDVPFQYSPACAIGNHKIGQDLEKYLTGKYGIKPAAEGTLREVFVHVEGSYCRVDPATRSKENSGQARVALDFLTDFVKTAKADPSHLVVISPYRGVVAQINRYVRQQEAYSPLNGMPEASTVDSFQGREGDICGTLACQSSWHLS